MTATKLGYTVSDRSAIEQLQLTALRSLLAQVRETNPFYRNKLAGRPEPRTMQEFFESFPFTSKEELVQDQRAHPPYGTNLTYPLEQYTRFSQTSATTDVPLRWLDTNESWNWMIENWMEVLRISGVQSGDRIFFAFSFGPFLGFWTSFEAGTRLGCMCLPGGGMSSLARLQAIIDNRVTVLCCTPTYAIHLAQVAADGGIDLSQSAVRLIVVAGEAGGSIAATRAYLERLWQGARVRDHHGMTEIGPVSFECPQRERVLHVMESRSIAEIVDPETGLHVSPGERGELVLTNPGRIASPLIRYRTGDIVRSAKDSPCRCGRVDLALEGGILGRADDMVVIRGVNVYPSAVEEVLRRFPAITEYRVEIHSNQALPELAVQIEPRTDNEDTASLVSEVEAALRAALNLRIPVTIVPPGTLPRFELKAKRWARMD